MVKIFKNLLIHFLKQIHFTLLKSQYCLWITWKAPLKLIKNVCKLIYRLEELNEFLNHYRCWLFYHSQKFFFLLLHESQDNFFCCKNIFIIVKTFFFYVAEIFSLLRKFFFCCENIFTVVRIVLFTLRIYSWKFFPPLREPFFQKQKFLLNYAKTLW